MSPQFSAGGRRRSNVAVRANPAPITVSAALARATQIVPTGVDTDGYANGAPAFQANYDLQGFESIGYVDWDSANNSGQCVAECGTAHGGTVKMIRLAQATSQSEISVIGGKASGDQPESLTWGICKHGRTVQTDWNAGGTSGAATTNDGGSLLLGPNNGSWWLIAGYRAYNVMDGITINGPVGSTASHATVYVQDSYVGKARDTIFNCESGHVFRVWDCLVEGSYGLIDVRNGPDVRTLANIWEHCLIRLQKQPGGFRYPASAMTHDKIYKTNANAPKQHLLNCTVAIEDSVESPDFPSDGVFTGTTICWLGTGACSWTLPADATVLNRDGSNLIGAQAFWDSKRANWLTRHGFPSNTANPYTYAVDMATMLSPSPPPA